MQSSLAWLLAIAALVGSASAFPTSSCPEGFVWFGGRCFAKFTSPLGWEQAEQQCQEKGGHLATIGSILDNEVLKLLCFNGTTSNDDRACWIGLNDRAKEGSFQWTNTNMTAAENMWAFDWAVHRDNNYEPNNLPKRSDGECADDNSAPECGANCVWLYGADGTLRDWPCTDELPYLCETDAEETFSSYRWRFKAEDRDPITIAEIQLFHDAECNDRVNVSSAQIFTSMSIQSILSGRRSRNRDRSRGNDTDDESAPTTAPSADEDNEVVETEKLEEEMRMFDDDEDTTLKLTCDPGSEPEQDDVGDEGLTDNRTARPAIRSCRPEVQLFFPKTTEIQCARMLTKDDGDSPRDIRFERLELPRHFYGMKVATTPGEWSVFYFPETDRFKDLYEEAHRPFDLDIAVNSITAGAFMNSSRVRLVRRPVTLMERSCLDYDADSEVEGLGLEVAPEQAVTTEMDANGDTQAVYQTWKNVVIDTPGMYEICHCFSDCELAKQWRDVGEISVAGLHRDGLATVQSGRVFSLLLPGWALPKKTTDEHEIASRLKIISDAENASDAAPDTCGRAAASADVKSGIDCDGATECHTAPTTALIYGQEWADLKIVSKTAKNYTVCHCLKDCGNPDRWQDVGTVAVGVPDHTCNWPVACSDYYPECVRYPLDPPRDIGCEPEGDAFTDAENEAYDSDTGDAETPRASQNPPTPSPIQPVVVNRRRDNSSRSDQEDQMDESLADSVRGVSLRDQRERMPASTACEGDWCPGAESATAAVSESGVSSGYTQPAERADNKGGSWLIITGIVAATFVVLGFALTGLWCCCFKRGRRGLSYCFVPTPMARREFEDDHTHTVTDTMSEVSTEFASTTAAGTPAADKASAAAAAAGGGTKKLSIDLYDRDIEQGGGNGPARTLYGTPSSAARQQQAQQAQQKQQDGSLLDF